MAEKPSEAARDAGNDIYEECVALNRSDHELGVYVYYDELKAKQRIQQAIDHAVHDRDRQIAELVEALEEVVTLSDRKHDAWDRAKVLIARHKETPR